MSSSDNAAFLGQGWSFPPSFDLSTRAVSLVSGDTDIRQSLYVLFSTLRGERVMLPDYGCNLSSYVFATADSSLFTAMRAAISSAVLYFEPRITVDQIIIIQDPATPNLLTITLDYTVRLTNTRSNMVYPFYLQGEGNNVRRIV